MFRKLLLAAEARIAVTTTAQKDQNPDESHPKPIPQELPQELPPHPHPKLKPPLPQQHRRIRIKKMLLEPLPPVVHSHPQPQFVAAKSLMFVPPDIFFTVYHMYFCLP